MPLKINSASAQFGGRGVGSVLDASRLVWKFIGRIRICAEFSTGLNNVLDSNRHTLPLPEVIFSKMSGCRYFSRVNYSDVYRQVEMDESC